MREDDYAKGQAGRGDTIYEAVARFKLAWAEFLVRLAYHLVKSAATMTEDALRVLAVRGRG